MSNISVDYDVLNQRGSPAWFTDTFANIPTAGFVGRMFISTDTFAFYRDTGTGWDLIGGPGTGTITGSGVTGQVSFFNGTQVLAGNNNLFWDNTNSRLGINTTTPGVHLDIHSTGNTLIQLNNTTTANSNISFQNQSVAKWRVGNVYNGGANSFDIQNAGLSTNAISINSTTNKVDFGSTIGNGTFTYTLPSATGTLALTSNIPANPVGGTGTTNTLPKFTGASTIGNSNITDTGSLITLGSNTTISSGSLGIGTSSLTGYSLIVSKNITGSVAGYGVSSNGQIQSDVTIGRYFSSTASTQAATFSAQIYHYQASQGTIGAGSTITNQIGFLVDSTLIGATNNYGFYGNILSGTNRWNLYMVGTADNYLAGSLGIGSTSLTGYSLRVTKNITGSTVSYGVRTDGVVQSDVTSTAAYFSTSSATQASSFTVNNLRHYEAKQSTFGAGSTVNAQCGFFVENSLTGGAVSNRGFESNLAAASGTWNFYASGTAANYLAGVLNIGTTTLSGFSLDVNGTARISNNLTINPANTAITGLDVASNNTSIRADSTNGFPRQLLITMGSGTLIQFTAKGYSANYITDLAFYTATAAGVNANPAIYITSSNNIGFGTGTPTFQLELSTDSAAKPTSALWTISSDRRIKENIKPYLKGLKELLIINPVTYDYNGLGGFVKGRGGVGIIAQEIIDILPDSVSSTKRKLNKTDEEETDILNFNGHELTYILINAIKEINEKLVKNNIN